MDTYQLSQLTNGELMMVKESHEKKLNYAKNKLSDRIMKMPNIRDQYLEMNYYQIERVYKELQRRQKYSKIETLIYHSKINSDKELLKIILSKNARRLNELNLLKIPVAKNVAANNCG